MLSTNRGLEGKCNFRFVIQTGLHTIDGHIKAAIGPGAHESGKEAEKRQSQSDITKARAWKNAEGRKMQCQILCGLSNRRPGKNTMELEIQDMAI